ncbi:MAG: type II toxin-antitoxin system PemK/MazF family toxin [Clostridia bacterium]|nr:type II toxin-antitoxin system PemK/MazF family toxin [Clostridia bacterium]
MENNNLSDFMKLAYKYGRVKDLHEAFEEFPVEEEWHKGKVENLLEEIEEKYDIYEIGDIVFVKEYHYVNGEKGTNHLFVIVDQNNIAIPIENFGMLISSNLDKLKYNSNKLIEKDKCNGLNKDSIVKTDVVYKILNSQIIFKIGKVDLDKVEEYKRSFYDSINNNL